MYRAAPVKAKAYFNAPNNEEIIAIVSLLDLYGPDIYPASEKTVDQKYRWGKKHIEDIVNNRRFHQYFAVHELEAWLLSDPSIHPASVAKAIPAGRDPETINFTEPPKALLKRLYREKKASSYKEVTMGYDLFNKLDPNVAYQRCNYLKILLDDMLDMAKEQGL